MPHGREFLDDDRFWYRDGVFYEVHIKAFFDSDNDGIGDFKGLTQKLDYLKDLGIAAVWLLPFYPSPLRDDGYDIADFFDIHPTYGTLRDFREFLREAHRRGIRVITELVLNHTSDQHPWFQRARRAKPGSAYRDFYVWSDDPNRYSDARIIFRDFENSNWTWDPVANAYYWHRFYSHQPDLNYDNPHVQKAMFRVIDFWMRLGVDGMRLDAVPYLFEREGTNCENLPQTYEYLRQLRAHVEENFDNRMLLAEANQWPEDAVAYFGSGDMCHMAFHFPLMPRMFMALQMEDNFPIVDILDQTPHIPENCQWALFLRNHDELTLEMVTDEERDYMYRMYARDPLSRINLGIRRRLYPLMGNDRRKIALLYGLLFSLPGTPVIYYGNEVGMGDNYHLGDRDGVRTPMQWSPDKNAGFSRADPQQLYLPVIIDYVYHYQTINVENEEKSTSSPLWFMRRFIALRKRHKAFGRGTMRIVASSNSKIFSFIREYEDEKILVAINLSRLPQMSTLNLAEFAGMVPQELLSRNHFHPIEQGPYVLTFGSHGIYFFLLGREEVAPVGIGGMQGLEAGMHWADLFKGKMRETLENEVLPAYIRGCRWFGGKARQIQQLAIAETAAFPKDSDQTHIVLVDVEYTEGLSDTYTIPLAIAEGGEADRVSEDFPSAVVAPVRRGARKGVLYDAVYNESFCRELFGTIARRRRIRTSTGELVGYTGKGYGNDFARVVAEAKPAVLRADQSNTAILLGDRYFMKLYRHPDAGINPDLEMSRFLTEEADFPHVPAFAGGLELKRKGEEPIAIAILQSFVPNQGEGLSYFLSGLYRYYEGVLVRRAELPAVPRDGMSLVDLAMEKTPPVPEDFRGAIPVEMASLLGTRSAQMHLALCSRPDNPDFAPEKFSLLWQRSVFQSMQSMQKRVFQLLSSRISHLPPETAGEASEVLARGNRIIPLYQTILKQKLSANRTRLHGDYHLGQVLYTGKDFVIIDFEGEPARTLSERRLKNSPLKDVAAMIRSFHYAAYIALFMGPVVRPEDVPGLEPWAELWYRTVAASFLRAYVETVKGSGLIPGNRDELNTLLTCFVLDKALYELGYELNSRPDWVTIPVRGIRHLLETTG